MNNDFHIKKFYQEVGRAVCTAVAGGLAGAVVGAASHAALGESMVHGVRQEALSGLVSASISSGTKHPLAILFGVIGGTVVGSSTEHMELPAIAILAGCGLLGALVSKLIPTLR